ncbi:response regulator transcription factor [Chengkuizengella axinellae]|uniref:Response regulator transcription factor n=1 Tax=Chengkuizengella axinellae TaxID=3064388 RepID=A0ABT9J3F2_9BACL|nr:response regulator transcription factor [Chengkuizengella sp. 2205SS18-9]MDP5275972.1 response regulator transcription factor [Chengkuizengella sp. 2205SS18-9]
MKILVVDDEFHIRKVIGDYLRTEGYEVFEGTDGLDCIEQLKSRPDVDLILLDVRMPKLTGFEAIEQIKKITDAPILFLTALDESFDEIKGLNLGADDYITKPFRYDILIARVNSALRRRKALKPTVFESKNFKMDFSKREVKIFETPVTLTKMEFELLEYFVKNNELVLDRNRILDSVWGYDYYGDPRTVDTHVKTLRVKLGEYGEWILTKRGVGYQFKVE